MVSDRPTFDVLNWDGSLSSTDFHSAACSFAENWNKFNSSFPEWSWIRCSNRCSVTANNVEEGYLALQNVLLPMSLEELDDGNQKGNGEPSFSDIDEPIDSATLIDMFSDSTPGYCQIDLNYRQLDMKNASIISHFRWSFCKVESNDQNMHRYDFHIANSPSYRVPVLYFHASTNDGQPLTLADIEKDLPPDSAKKLMESKWTFITQVEHPYLNRPWYTLHPCGTSEWMKLLLATANSWAGEGVPVEQYLISWFSVVGQVFGFRIPLEMLASFDSSS